MPPFPLNLSGLLLPVGVALVFFAIGLAFGWVLEVSGFGKSTKLAAQFYFKELTVLKVMFTGIVVAMVLIFGASAVGLLDYNTVYVNETYLWPGIAGGLIMGVGFIVGGFCPGTSLVSAATGKIDGIFFVLGALAGIFAFGETVWLFEDFFYSSYLGRFTLPQWLGLDTGVVVVLVVLMALFMFWGGEQLERLVGKVPTPKGNPRRVAAGALVASALAVAFIGQPTTADKWGRLANGPTGASLTERQVQIAPGELLATRINRQVSLVVLDVRSEAEYNQFHLKGARLMPFETLADHLAELRAEGSAHTVFVVVSNDEARATEAWKLLVAESVNNVYILEGGVNQWLATFAASEAGIVPTPAAAAGSDQLAYRFDAALGDRYAAANPNPHEWELEYTPKIKLQQQRGPAGGGCG